MIELTTHSPEDTRALGRRLGAQLPAGTVVGLDGDLGAGKTWLCKGLVEGIGTFDAASVKSPAYNLVHEYPVYRPDGATQLVIHIDFYRLEELSDTDALLFAEYFERRDTIVLVEWARRFLAELVPGFLAVELQTVPGADEQRQIRLDTVGDGYDDLLATLTATVSAHVRNLA